MQAVIEFITNTPAISALEICHQVEEFFNRFTVFRTDNDSNYDIWMHITDHLDITDLIAALGVCKIVRSAAIDQLCKRGFPFGAQLCGASIKGHVLPPCGNNCEYILALMRNGISELTLSADNSFETAIWDNHVEIPNIQISFCIDCERINEVVLFLNENGEPDELFRGFSYSTCKTCARDIPLILENGEKICLGDVDGGGIIIPGGISRSDLSHFIAIMFFFGDKSGIIGLIIDQICDYVLE